MCNATDRLKKHRVYECLCGAKPCRPLQASDTVVRPYPKPCDHCGRSLVGRPFMIEDLKVGLREALADKGEGGGDGRDE